MTTKYARICCETVAGHLNPDTLMTGAEAAQPAKPIPADDIVSEDDRGDALRASGGQVWLTAHGWGKRIAVHVGDAPLLQHHGQQGCCTSP